LNELAPRLDRIRAKYEAANLRGYTLVQEGMFRYFPAEEARQVRQLLQVSNSKFLQFTENWRNTAFNLDLSPLTGIQVPNGFLADARGTGVQLIQALRQVRNPRDLLRGFSADALADDIAKDVIGPTTAGKTTYIEFASATGRAVTAGTLPEFAGGILNRIPGFTKANESMFTFITRMQKGLFDRLIQKLEKTGIPREIALAASGDIVNKVYPMVNSRVLGQSPARATLFRSTLTSISFIRQPPALMADAARGLVKLGLRKPATPKEQLALQLMVSMASTIMGISIISNQISAFHRGLDPMNALRESLNPTSGKFMSVV
jgi:hypothetical protein